MKKYLFVLILLLVSIGFSSTFNDFLNKYYDILIFSSLFLLLFSMTFPAAISIFGKDKSNEIALPWAIGLSALLALIQVVVPGFNESIYNIFSSIPYGIVLVAVVATLFNLAFNPSKSVKIVGTVIGVIFIAFLLMTNTTSTPSVQGTSSTNSITYIVLFIFILVAIFGALKVSGNLQSPPSQSTSSSSMLRSLSSKLKSSKSKKPGFFARRKMKRSNILKQSFAEEFKEMINYDMFDDKRKEFIDDFIISNKKEISSFFLELDTLPNDSLKKEVKSKFRLIFKDIMSKKFNRSGKIKDLLEAICELVYIKENNLFGVNIILNNYSSFEDSVKEVKNQFGKLRRLIW